MRQHSLLFVLSLLTVTCVQPEASVPLENWRMRLFTIASEYEAASGSESRMFWDGIDSIQFPDGLFFKQDSLQKNHWVIEPSFAYGSIVERDNSHSLYHGELFNEFKWFNCSARHLLHIDSRYKDDPLYPSNASRALRGRIEEATLQATWEHAWIRIGRQRRNWGPFPDRSLILSSNPYSYDAVESAIFSKYFEFRHLFAPFSSNRTNLDSDAGVAYNRFLTAHSLNLIFGRWGTIGFTETVLFTRTTAFPDLQYINPFSIYSVVNTNYEGNGNLMLGAQWNIHPGSIPVSFKGQIMLDDFQVDNKIATDKEPNHWGIDAGVYWRDPLSVVPWHHCMKLEWQNASPWLYTVSDENAARGERYIVNRQSLGFAENDGYKISTGCSVLPDASFAGTLGCSYSRKGPNTPLTSWQDAQAIPGLPVASNIPMTKRTSVDCSLFYYYKRLFDVAFDGSVAWNRSYVRSNSNEFDLYLGIQCSIHYGDVFFALPQ